MKNLKNLKNRELANLFARLDRVFLKKETYFYEHFQDIYDDLKAEINRRNRAEIFRTCCRCLKNRYKMNQFTAAAQYADSALNKPNYWENDSTYEISQFDTKSGHPVVVDLVMFWEG